MAEAIFPKCFYAGHDDVGEIIVLDDLKESGFRMQNRLTGLEVGYCELVMKVWIVFATRLSNVTNYLNNISFSILATCETPRSLNCCKEIRQ